MVNEDKWSLFFPQFCRRIAQEELVVHGGEKRKMVLLMFLYRYYLKLLLSVFVKVLYTSAYHVVFIINSTVSKKNILFFLQNEIIYHHVLMQFTHREMHFNFSAQVIHYIYFSVK